MRGAVACVVRHFSLSHFYRNARLGYADLRLARLRQHHDLRRPLSGAHPAGAGPHPERELSRADDAPRVRRLRGQHRLTRCICSAATRASWARSARSTRSCYMDRFDAARPVDAKTCWCVPDTLLRAGDDHHRSRKQSDHRVPSGRDDAVASEPRRRSERHHARHRRTGRLRRHDPAFRTLGRRRRAVHLRSGSGFAAVRRRDAASHD